MRAARRSGVPPLAGRKETSAPGADGHPDLIRLGLFFFIIVTISTVHFYIAPLRMLRVGVLLWLTVLGGVFLLPRLVRWQNISRSRPATLVVVFSLIVLASIPFGMSMGASGNYFINSYSRVLVFFFLLVVALRGPRDYMLFLQAFAASIGILAFLSLTVMDMSQSFTGIRLESGAMYDANDIGVLLITGLPLVILVMERTTGVRRFAAGFTLLLIPASLALTGSRGGLVGAAVVLPGLLLLMSHVPLVKRVTVMLVMAVGLTVAAPPGYWERMSTILSPTEDYNFTDYYGRKEIAKRGVMHMLRNPVVGVGLMNFGRADGTLVQTLDSGGQVRWIAPHNTYVQVGAELGLGAFIIWLTLLYQGSVGLLRRRRRLPRHWARGTEEQRLLVGSHRYLPLAFLGFAVTSFFTSHAYTPPFYILVAFLVAVHLFTAREKKRERAAESGSATLLGRRGVLKPQLAYGVPGTSNVRSAAGATVLFDSSSRNRNGD